MIGFIYVSGTRVVWPLIGSSAEERRAKYLRHQFDLAHKRFGKMISATASSRAAEALSYAILLYETFNRPPIYQAIERTLLFPVGLAQTLGPMQVPTQLALDDSDLVRLGVEQMNLAFENAFASFMAVSDDARRAEERAALEPQLAGLPAAFACLQTYHQDEIIRRAAGQYNARSDYPREVAGIFGFLRSDHFRELDPDVRAAKSKAAALAVLANTALLLPGPC